MLCVASSDLVTKLQLGYMALSLPMKERFALVKNFARILLPQPRCNYMTVTQFLFLEWIPTTASCRKRNELINVQRVPRGECVCASYNVIVTLAGGWVLCEKWDNCEVLAAKVMQLQHRR